MGRVDLASVAFDGLAILTLGSALVVAAARDLVRAALGLMGTLAGVAGLYVMLSADFLAVVQLLVYLGGASVLFLLAAALEAAPAAGPEPSRRGTGFTVALLAFALAVVAAGTLWPVAVAEKLVSVPRAAGVGHALLGAYVLPFELASIVLVTALVGALVVARRTVRSRATP